MVLIENKMSISDFSNRKNKKRNSSYIARHSMWEYDLPYSDEDRYKRDITDIYFYHPTNENWYSSYTEDRMSAYEEPIELNNKDYYNPDFHKNFTPDDVNYSNYNRGGFVSSYIIKMIYKDPSKLYKVCFCGNDNINFCMSKYFGSYEDARNFLIEAGKLSFISKDWLFIKGFKFE